ncbi:MAG: choice-of-anchor J domain-containing protein, partial [Chloroflexota bacterium]|nr:choice-of-anchor J domain-containing protein [Chloroflexota bacterium]
MVSGTVYDGGIESGPSHGYPLYASLTFSAVGFSETIFTDPFTGSYESDLYLGQEYSVSVEAVPTGYETLDTSFTPDTDPDTQDFTLYIDAGACFAPGYEDTGAYIVEGFETDLLPAGWVNYDYADTGDVWQFNDPGGVGNLTPGGDGGFAILNIEEICFGGFHNAGLRTPVMDFSGETIVSLDFDTDYNNASSDTATVRVSNDNGATWIPVWTQTETFNGHVSLDISTKTTGYAEVIVEFRYEGSLAWWWEVDDVYIGAHSCDPIPGGVVAGFAFDDNTLDPLIGADVMSPDVVTQTMERSCDAENTGLYWVFQPTTTDPEDVEFTASKVSYSNNSTVVSVVKDAVTQQDFYLGTGHLLFDPTAFEVTMVMEDAPREEVLTISNDGTGAADFELFEIDIGVELSAFLPDATVRNKAASNDDIKISSAGTSKENPVKSAVNSMPNADIELILDDGTAENNIGVGGTWEFIFLNRFMPDPGAFPFTLNEIQVFFDDTVSVGDEIILAVYENTLSSEDPAVGANLLASFPETVHVTSSWNNYTLPGGVLMIGPGEILIGVVALEIPGISYLPAAIDETASQQRSWAGWWLSSPIPPDLTLPPDDTWGLIDEFGFPGNWLIRGMGSAGGSDVIWLSEDPVSGTVASSDSTDVALTFDPSMLEQPGDYFAELQAQNDTPYVYDNIPVTLHLLRPET